MGVDYESIDLVDEATLQADLNTYRVPARLRNKFDIVTNFGTTEHIFDQSNCFQVIHNLTKVGGHMVHFLPTAGYFFHCLYKYDPKYFILLAKENNYDIAYAGFGDLEWARNLDARFATWAQYAGASALRYDSLLVEVVLRKTTDQPFRPGVDRVGDDFETKHVFAAPIRSLRDVIRDSEPMPFGAPLEALPHERAGASGPSRRNFQNLLARVRRALVG